MFCAIMVLSGHAADPGGCALRARVQGEGALDDVAFDLGGPLLRHFRSARNRLTHRGMARKNRECP